MEGIQYAKFCLDDVKTRILVNKKLAIRHYNMSLTMKTTTSTGKIQKYRKKLKIKKKLRKLVHRSQKINSYKTKPLIR